MLTKKQKAFRRKWVAALRSGKYKQADGFLRDVNRHCCLGVACDIAEPNRWFNDEHRGQGTLPDFMWFKKLTGLGSFDVKGLAEMNDGDGVPRHTFAEIADTIEFLTLADSEP